MMNDRVSRDNVGTAGRVSLLSLGLLLAAGLLLGGTLLGADEPAPDNDPAEAQRPTVESPLLPQESLKQFRLHPKLRIELVAAEPEVVDPVAIAFDKDGRMWVAEMRDYPHGPPEGGPPLSRIRVLQDHDHDGYYETSRIFADRFLFANGIQPWRDGVIVTLSGAVAYLRDTNGDGQADERETWFTGFAEKNPQLRANHPTFALDNHIYIANGLRGGDVIAKKEEWSTDAEPVAISGMDFRFHPFSGVYEAVSGMGQFGLTFDDFGNRFVCSNRNPCKHIVLEDRYIKRNPHLAVPSVAHDVSPPGADSRVFPISRAWTTSALHAGQFTAACGVTIYRGDLLPEEFRGNSFTCEPTGNLVHRDVLQPQGATFTSQPGREGIEFLATRDEWFRPVNLANGPDGALYVVDMYRAVIEHPQFMPDELKSRPDLRDGDDRGRIYRIVPKGATGSASAEGAENTGKASGTHPTSRLAEMTGEQLVDQLTHPNAWQRETAARLLFERQDRSIREELIALSRHGHTPQARIHALWLLNGLGTLSAELVRDALDDEHPRVREHAVRLSEPWLNDDEFLRQTVLALTEDADARVLFQTALSLGETEVNDAVIKALAAIAVRDADDPWTRRAVLSSVAEKPADLLTRIFARVSGREKWDEAGIADLVREISEVIGSRQKADEIELALVPLTQQAAQSTPHSEWRVRLAGMNGLGEGLRRRGKTLSPYMTRLSEPLRREGDALFERAAELAQSEQAISLRLEAVQVLEHAEYKIAGPALKSLIAEEADRTILSAAIDSLAAHDDPEIASVLLAEFPSQLPPVRRAILDAMLANTARTRTLLKEIEAGRLAVTELDSTRRRRLTRHRNPEIRNKAKQILAEAVPEDRKTVLEKYQRALSLPADPERGREVFRKHCTQCHRIGDLGVNVAPDIADSRTKTPDELLVSILDPNRAIDNNYFSYTVVTKGGRVHTGIIAAETASSITLKQPENKTVTVLRQDVQTLRSDRVSLMPVGLEKDITIEQMADLISFIKNWRYLEGGVPIEVGQ